jgi:hypothetical protein
MRLKVVAVVASMGLALSGCTELGGAGYGGVTPVQSEPRVVTPKQDAARTVVLYEPLVFLDQGPLVTASHGVRLPNGIYGLEAEDSDNFYYRAPADIEYRTFGSDGKVSGRRFMPGGLYVSKATISLVPIGAYVAIDESHKILTWRLGGEFSRLEGKKWIRNGGESTGR